MAKDEASDIEEQDEDLDDIEDPEDLDEEDLDEDLDDIEDDLDLVDDDYEETDEDYDADEEDGDGSESDEGGDEHDEETAEALEELENQELQLLEDEASEALLVDEVEELRAMRRAELTMNVDAQSQKSDEFVCQSCFMVKRISQLANRRKMICQDCVS